jgi:hypothetical protein
MAEVGGVLLGGGWNFGAPQTNFSSNSKKNFV